MKTVGTFILLIIGVSAIAQEEWNMLPGEINAEADQHLIPSKSKNPDHFWHVVKDAANHIIDSIPYTDDDVNGTRKLYKDGKLWQVIPYKFNKIEGEKLYYFPNGAIRAQTDYVNNQRQGKRTIYYEGSPKQKRPKKQYDMGYFWGLLHGPLKEYSQPPKWHLVSRTEYQNGKKHGDYTEYSKQGYKQLSIPYENDAVSDSASTYYRDGNVLCRFIYTKDSIKNFRYVYYKPNGKVMHVNNWYNNQPKGHIVTFNKAGKRLNEAHYENNLKNGLYKEYGEKEVLLFTSYYKDDKLNGLKTDFYEDGTKKLETPYEDDQKSGVQYVYNELGLITQSFEYKNDLLNGWAKVYFDNGNVFYKTPYVNGVKHGKEFWYNKAGKKLAANKYKEGDCKREHKAFYEIGKLKAVYWLTADNSGYIKDRFDGRKFETIQYFVKGNEVDEATYNKWKKSR